MRKYRDFGTQKAAGIILVDILNDDTSAGWSGSHEEVKQMLEWLAPFNVILQDEYSGTWGLRDEMSGPVMNRAPKSGVVFVEDDEDEMDTMIMELPRMEQMEPNVEFESKEE